MISADFFSFRLHCPSFRQSGHCGHCGF